MFRKIKNATDFIEKKLGKIDVAIITGTGIDIEIKGNKLKKLLYSEVPGMPIPSTKSHKGYFEFYKKGNLNVVVAFGRFHYYEKYSMQEVVFLPRVLGLAGAKLVILTNAAGGLNPLFKKGDLMVVKDHINLMGANPLKGDNIEELGEKFPDMSEPYTLKYAEKLKKTALSVGEQLREGIYVGVSGPSMETPAETRFFRLIGGDAIGMSTIPEVIALNHMGVDRMAVSVITNVNLPDCMEKAPIDEVISVAKSASKRLSKIINRFLEEGL
ncbi:purine-nucleoside phosphorylase [Hippea maritima]|uniref:Purine nucleoside phosphorylase n=1 Tax=Hippea maritima (strain ATCC 700847 / DSM 10411 / MH2) TaxID=760142 RepID=F2LWH3_HIPMA|nr:purine-nucleoside phosphorylase [Hippea maritima]AEA34082.1 inosine guanosine and xanthosine phosphorylase family [Hippea maritima DSM 10411]